MKKFLKANLIVCLFFIFIGGCAKRELIVKYKTYKFNEYIKLEQILFKPYKDDISFKSKIKLTLENGKTYTFYALVYNKNGVYRIFSYTFFGKKVIDILFDKKSYIVLDNKPEMYIVINNKIDEKDSLFYFLKEILNGIVIKNIKYENGCIFGSYNGYQTVSCEKDKYRKVNFFKNNNLIRSFNITESKENFPEKIALISGKNKLTIELLEYIKSDDFKKKFFDYTKKFKVYYLKNIKAVENAIME